MASRAMTNFNKLKAQGLTDEQAIKQSFGLTAKGTAKIRKADKVKKLLKRKGTSKLQMAVTGKLKRRSHSPAVAAGPEVMKTITASRRRLHKEVAESRSRLKRYKRN